FLPMVARSFLPQWVFGLALLVVLSLWHHRLLLGAGALVGLVLASGQLRAPVSQAMPGFHGQGITIAHLNLLQPNRDKTEAIRAALAQGADLLAFQEVDTVWAARLEEKLAVSHPHRLVVPRTDCYGIALYSRLPLQDLHAVDLVGSPAITATLPLDNSALRLWSVHARSPGGLDDMRRRNRQLQLLGEHLGRNASRTVVIGDLNTVSWDDAFWALCTTTGLRAQGDAFAATFPALMGAALIPIDHVLVGRELTATKHTFTIPGSDHLGLLSTVRPCP
ncbi:MAG: endonuclease/exonuclease/phosphatase family protein, partial [Flavobacteriales bacterium]|nr:endonuclease/exonuclease/phosphatase family protein [Flavobacteriales bacterium]